jgi:predicted nuclease of restriction endonuclease-like (RecB) superfamily
VGHNVLLLERLDSRDARLFYAAKAAEHGWSRSILRAQVASGLHAREGRALTNFAARLPEHTAAAAQRITRDPYNLSFLDIAQDIQERALVADLQRFMLELGAGFAFVGTQVHLEVMEDDFYIDILFFHIPTNRYVVIDLKIGKFVPRDAGQINFYVSVVDDQLSLDHHAPAIGLVLCASHNASVVRYALDGLSRPVGVASWRLSHGQTMPEDSRRSEAQLPSQDVLQAGLDRIVAARIDEVRAVEGAGHDEPIADDE